MMNERMIDASFIASGGWREKGEKIFYTKPTEISYCYSVQLICANSIIVQIRPICAIISELSFLHRFENFFLSG
jgi:hypothetical protein